MKYLNIYGENGRPEEMAFPCNDDEVAWWQRKKNNLRGSLKYARKRITVHTNESKAKEEFWGEVLNSESFPALGLTIN